jgi:hypothetical protein
MAFPVKNICILAVLAAFSTSCDKVTRPLERTAPVPVDSSALYVRKVLLEDHTGHKCGNCPDAAVVAENLLQQYGDRLVVMAVHGGHFATTDPKHPMEFRTVAGNDWISSSGFGITGWPTGLINRKAYDGTANVTQKETKWPSWVALGLQDKYVLGLTISSSYNAGQLTVSVNGKFKTAYPNDVKLSVVLLEDSIIGPQSKYTNDGGQTQEVTITDYVFMHTLRGALNGSWGQTLKASPVNAKDSVEVTVPVYTVDPVKFNVKHLSVVAFAHDASTREVLQVEKVKMLKN